jgi:hypothetical protein
MSTKNPIDDLATVVAQVANAYVGHASQGITRDTWRRSRDLGDFWD